MEENQDPIQDNEEAADAAAEPTMEALLQSQASFQERLAAKEIVWVKVVQVQSDRVLVDIGEKQEGSIPAADFAGHELPKIGARIPALLVGRSRGEQGAQLSWKKARGQMGWDQALKSFEQKARVRGTVTSAVKGGFIVDLGGVSAFLPASLADLRPVRKPEIMLKTGVRCYIIEANKDKKQLVVSRKAVLEEESKKRKEKMLSEIKVGDIRIGRVSHVTPAGVSVNLGGLEAFIPTAELSWKDPEKARGGVQHGSKVRAKVIRIETETGKVTMGLKQLTANPADLLKKKFPPKAIVTAKIGAKTEAGVKCTLPPDFPAFCETAELVTDEKEQPVWPKEGDSLKAIVLGVNYTTYDVRISLRRYEEIQDRKRVAKYLKGAPKLTLGQILTEE